MDSGDVGANIARLDDLEDSDYCSDEDSADEDSDEPGGQGVCPVVPPAAKRRRAT